MITKEQAMEQPSDIYMLGEFDYQGAPVRWRANGQCKTWKTRPSEFRLPVKYGAYDYDYITQDNAKWFTLDEQECYLDLWVRLSKRPDRMVYWAGPGRYVLLRGRMWAKMDGSFTPIGGQPEVDVNHPYDLKHEAQDVKPEGSNVDAASVYLK